MLSCRTGLHCLIEISKSQLSLQNLYFKQKTTFRCIAIDRFNQFIFINFISFRRFSCAKAKNKNILLEKSLLMSSTLGRLDSIEEDKNDIKNKHNRILIKKETGETFVRFIVFLQTFLKRSFLSHKMNS